MKQSFKSLAAFLACLLAVAVLGGSPARAESEIKEFIKDMAKSEKADAKQESFAEKLLRKDAEAGDAEAQYSLAETYLLGQGAAQDCASARRWFEKAAAQGHAGAQRRLGEMFSTGRCVPQDKSAAKDWFRKACAGGDQNGCDSHR